MLDHICEIKFVKNQVILTLEQLWQSFCFRTFIYNVPFAMDKIVLCVSTSLSSFIFFYDKR